MLKTMSGIYVTVVRIDESEKSKEAIVNCVCEIPIFGKFLSMFR